VLGETPRFLLGDGTERRKRERLCEAADAGAAETVELRLYDADDEPYWARLSVTPVRDDSGRVTHFVAIQQDVTERRDRVRWLYRLFEHGPLMFARTRAADDGAVIEECDPSFPERLGHDREAVIGERLAAFYAAESVSALESDGYERAPRGELTVAERELVTADGDRVPCLLRAIPRYSDGDPVGTDVLLVDISEQRTQEQTLLATRERYQALLRSAPDPVFVADGASGAVLETNAAAEALRSEPRTDIVGRHYTELFPESDREAYRELFDEGTDGVVSTLGDDTQTKLVTADGESVPVETNLSTVELVSRSKKPVQELAWASIGNVLTAIQICEAHDRGVLVPWNSWRHEFYKPMGTLHDADCGGFIFAPEVGLHENVHELDFSSLYPNIICTRNVSPDVIRCDCHSDREDAPGLGYSICDDRGYLVDVLQPIIDARDEIKAAIRREKERDDPDEDHLAELEGRSGALKWILVACFGYQGFSNAKFGRIECHEAINAVAREILLTAKQRLEAGGWRVVHGIVDSIWVTPDPDVDDDDREDLETLATAITEEVEIRL